MRMSWNGVGLAIGIGAAVVLTAGGPAWAESSLEGLGRMRARFDQGGFTMYLLLMLSVVGLAFTLERLFHLRQAFIVPEGLIEQYMELWQRGQWKTLDELCLARPCSLSRMVRFMLRHRMAPAERLSQALSDMGWREMRPHLRRLHPLALVATVAPLLGLFGTVVGMIEAFEQFRVYGETGNPADFAGAISKALITTAFGLAIALPALAFHQFFKSLAQKYGDRLESEVGRLFETYFLLIPDERASRATTRPAIETDVMAEEAENPRNSPERGDAFSP
ncbi:MAG: MotA/TolQ/ExbB proton channel family protein [Phycisphaeraceae bacterium]|nr:MotA/TolQ/ExbB proton channel family protein [Phycisphaeraceae bacterium]